MNSREDYRRLCSVLQDNSRNVARVLSPIEPRHLRLPYLLIDVEIAANAALESPAPSIT